jgi:hypothetical protein
VFIVLDAFPCGAGGLPVTLCLSFSHALHMLMCFFPEMVQVLVWELQREMSQGMMRLVAGLKLGGKLPVYSGPFNVAEQRFDQRFAAFHVLSRPEPLCYSQYTEMMDTTGDMAIAINSFREIQLVYDAGIVFMNSWMVLTGFPPGRLYAMAVECLTSARIRSRQLLSSTRAAELRGDQVGCSVQ